MNTNVDPHSRPQTLTQGSSLTHTRRLIALAALILGGAVTSAHAQRHFDFDATDGLTPGAATWDAGTTSAWQTSATPGTTAPSLWTDGQAALFNTAGLNTVTISGTVSAAGLTTTVANTVTNIDGGTLILTGNIAVSGLGTSLTIGSGTAVTLNSAQALTTTTAVTINGAIGQIGGARSLSKAGVGTLTLTGANTYTGGTTVSAGILQLSGGNDRLSNTGNISIATGADADGINLGSNTQNTSGNVTVGRGTLSNGTINLTGAGSYSLTAKAAVSANLQGTLTTTLTVNNGANTATLSGNNTFGGGVTITGASSSVLNIGSATALGTGTLTFDGGTLGSTASLGLVSISNAITATGSNNYRFNPGSATTLEITSDLAGASNGVIKSEAGSIILSGNKTYGGVTTISRGTLSVTSLANGGSASSISNSSNAASNLLIGGASGSNPSTLAYVGNSAASTDRLFTAVFGPAGSSLANNAVDSAHTLTFSNAGSIVLSGTGVRTIGLGGTNTGENSFALQIGDDGVNATSFTKREAGKWILTGANTYTGVTNVSAGTLSVSSLANGGVASNIGQSSSALTNLLIGNGGTLQYTGAAASTNRLFTLAGTGTGHSFTLDASGSGAINFSNAGNLAYGTAGQTRFLTLTGSNTGENTLAATLQNNGSTSNSLTVNKTGTGTWLLAGVNTHTGVTTVSGGTLAVSNIANGGVASALGASSNLPTQLLLGNGTTLRYTGVAASTDRRFTVNGTAAGHGATIEASGTGAVSFTNTLGLGWNTNNQTRTLTLGGTNTDNNTFAGLIANNGTGAVSVTKADAGTWVLTGLNTYTGGTSVNGGTLVLNGTTSATGIFAVASGATLGGTGTVNGVLNVTGSIAPGNSIGILNAGTTTWVGAATAGTATDWAYELGLGNTSDLLNISGDFNKDITAGTVFRFDFLNSNVEGTFKLVDWSVSSTFDAGDFSATNLGDGMSGTFAVNGTQLEITVIPEPSTLMLMGLTGLALFAGLRRKKR